MEVTLHGTWTADIGDGKSYPIQLPGTLDENRIGHKDTGANQWHPDAALGNEDKAFQSDEIATRFTRHFTYEGEAKFTRCIDPETWNAIAGEIAAGKRVFLEAQRARVLRLLVDGKEVPDFVKPSVSTDHIFELTNIVNEKSELTLVSDNSYPGLPRNAIVYSSAATDETQTNWNGVLGYLRLRTEEQAFVGDIRVYPVKNTVTVRMKLYTSHPYSGEICLHSDALKEDVKQYVSTQSQFESTQSQPASTPNQSVDTQNLLEDTQDTLTEVVFEKLPLKEDVQRWDLEEGNLYELSVSLTDGETKAVTFGIRDFGDDGQGRLAINGRVFFLRSEANCAVFPETGHAPMTVEEWADILKRYRSYGVNCMRFHSHCPPEAAFTAADRMGMLMQPELSHWNPKDAFESECSYGYYRTELTQVLRMLANHPSFVMLAFGNELQAGEKGHERMRELLQLARDIDPTRLYADASNCHYGEIGCEQASDFYSASNFHDRQLRGTYANMDGYINSCYPSGKRNFDTAMEQVRKEYKKPVFGFEVGQFEVLPDFDEMEEFRGISDPANFRLIQKRVKEQGLEENWKRYVEATGEISRLAYREEVEAVMRTSEMSGISLLGLQDFPGQGTALVGMLNSHLQPKPFEFAKPEHFRSFFRDQLPLVLLPKYTWENTEKLYASVQVANYGKEALCGQLEYELREQPEDGRGYSFAGCGDEAVVAAREAVGQAACPKGTLGQVTCPAGALTEVGTVEISLDILGISKPMRFNLVVRLGEASNLYPIWVYPKAAPKCPEGIYETQHLDEKAKGILEAGGKVYLSPPSTKEALPSSIQSQFTTDFWSVGPFAGQEGGMGQLIDASHPVFDHFPTEFHTNWQWWPMAGQRAVILPKSCETIITVMDSYAFLRPMAQLLECTCGKGRLMFSSLGLQDLQQYPEARALLGAIYRYMDSDRFLPKQEMEMEVFEALVQK